MNDRNMARYLRLAVIINQIKVGNLTRDEGLALLNLPLTPDDPTTLVDDRELLDKSVEEVERILEMKRWTMNIFP